MKTKSPYFILVTLIYIGSAAKLIYIVTNRHNTPTNLFFECLFMMAMIGAYLITIRNIRPGKYRHGG